MTWRRTTVLAALVVCVLALASCGATPRGIDHHHGPKGMETGQLPRGPSRRTSGLAGGGRDAHRVL